jgi:hypothetical protein
MGLWDRLANWCLPPGTLRFGVLDGYLPPAPAGYRWVTRPRGLRIVSRADAVGARWSTGEWQLQPRVRARAGVSRHHRV